ncbi:DUF3817 domain-containing protein [Streptomyces sp. TP-A0874]|uniref:DUF3817 domain-containing protein n=1 Tax=Streptomyces sp. TP-A0874 TaxID=549819 RepID=UPI0008529432|nr:DUF3817 domain-containing protein [Streptomyces sp. TP-A0874]
MDTKTVSALRRLRGVCVPETLSFLLLLLCSVLKRTTDFDAVMVMGSIHGVLFVLFVVFWLDALNRAKWSYRTAASYFLLAVVPAGGFLAERWLRREIESREAAGAEAGAAEVREAAEGVVGS